MNPMNHYTLKIAEDIEEGNIEINKENQAVYGASNTNSKVRNTGLSQIKTLNHFGAGSYGDEKSTRRENDSIIFGSLSLFKLWTMLVIVIVVSSTVTIGVTNSDNRKVPIGTADAGSTLTARNKAPKDLLKMVKGETSRTVSEVVASDIPQVLFVGGNHSYPTSDPFESIGEEDAFNGEDPQNFSNATHSFDAIVIGAGWAGLKAAETLLAGGISNILLLEANDYIGGRARTVNDFIPGVPIDLGCEWLYKDGNDMASYMSKHGLADLGPTTHDKYYTNSFKSSTFFKQSIGEDCTVGTEMVGDYNELGQIDQLWSGRNGFQLYAKQVSERLRITNSDESYEKALSEFEKEHEVDEEERQWLNLLSDANLEVEYAGGNQFLSVKDVSYDGSWARTKYMAVEGAGFGNTAVSFSNAFNSIIKLNAKVTNINYEEHGNVIIEFVENGVAKKAITRTALVTVSLGVLKAGSINFTPSFSRQKQNAIDNMGFGFLNKCIMYWEEASDIVWPVDKTWLELVTVTDEDSGKWTSFFNPTNLKGVPTLVGFAGGRDAVDMEDQTDKEILDDVMKNLSAMFPSITRPKKVLITRWGKEANFLGSYSFQKVGRTFHEDAANLQERVGTLWFAGEATSGDGWYGTTVGSWETGKKAANQMVSFLK